jgi:tritrans,polycis-undecaprenyl-diphosphate synthase [geranylgeranyl-diphosphate specific]
MSLQEDIGRMISGRGYGIYESKLEKEVLENRIPNHVAVIMDGNRRYADDTGVTAKEGHAKGRDKLEEMLDWCIHTGVKVLTVFAFSTDNFSRPDDEVDFIMDLLENTFVRFADDGRIHGNKVALRVIGDRSMIPENVMNAVEYAEERTRNYSDSFLNVAVAYGGREEIVHAVKEIAAKVKNGSMEIAEISEESISDNLYTYDLPDPDLVLRTSGELRVSNFLLWQLAYSEFYFTDVYWPGFRYIDFLRAIRSFQQRSRRFGQ